MGRVTPDTRLELTRRAQLADTGTIRARSSGADRGAALHPRQTIS